MTDIAFDTTGLEDYLVSEELERDGVWLEFPMGRAFRVRRAGGSNRAYSRAIQAAVKPYRKRRRGMDDIDPDESDRIMRKVYAKTIIVDWRGIKDNSGNDVPFTEENVIAFFTAIPELFDDVVKLANELSTFSESLIEEAEEALGEG